MARARKAFETKGLKLTPLRAVGVPGDRAASHQAIGAYEVLDRLAARGERLAPISVYRAIDALVAAGIVHRFESRNAFFACHAGHEQRQLVLACEAAARGRGRRRQGVLPPSTRRPSGARFPPAPQGAVVEVWGLCANCAGKDSAMRRPDGLEQRRSAHDDGTATA